MLETDEVDDDYFTPVSSTSLANIFGSSALNEDKAGNTSLKYTPPQSKSVEPEESKPTECIFACALLGYEWFNNEYAAKGKLGFAVVKVVKTGTYNIVLYDSNKTTLSCTSITPSFELVIRGNSFISYFDNSRKHWSLYAKDNEISKITGIISGLNANIKHSAYKDEGPPEPYKLENSTIDSVMIRPNKSDKESDTDSSVNKKTKASILSRMASMGHSILPPSTLAREGTSDSSDTNENAKTSAVVRHKPIKSVIKRINSEKPTVDSQRSVIIKTDPVNNLPLCTYVNGQITPAVTNVTSTSNSTISSDLNLLMTEQRINNSEVRINVNRMSDKVDQILDKIKDMTIVNKNVSNTNYQAELAYKLLAEYENKIKMYEKILNSKETDNTTHPVDSVDQGVYQNKILEHELNNKEKDEEISKLRDELNHLKFELNDVIEKKAKIEDDYIKDIKRLTDDLAVTNKKLLSFNKKTESSDNSAEVTNKVKNIMNDTYRALVANFENDETYSGETIKSIMATIIKQVTIESLSESS